jgi:heat shock protein HspQ
LQARCGASFHPIGSKRGLAPEERLLERGQSAYTFTSQSVRAGTVERMNDRTAKFAIGQVVKHRVYPFRGVIFDVDPEFANTEEYWQSIPAAIRPHKEQPFYHLLAENDQNAYVAYVSEQNLLPDDSGDPVGHPQTGLIFEDFQEGQYRLRPRITH